MITSEIKVFLYPIGKIRELLNMYANDYFSLPLGRDDVEKYGFIRRKGDYRALIIVSQGRGVTDIPDNSVYNSIVSVHGNDLIDVSRLMQKFVQATGIDAREAPEFLKRATEELMKSIPFQM